MDIAIFIADSNGAFPVPASKGGAVATLVGHLVEEANKDSVNHLTVVSYYEEKAFELSKKYQNVTFKWINRHFLIRLLDKLLFKSVQLFFPQKKSMSYATLFSLAWYIICGTSYLKKTKFDKIVLENNIPIAWIIKLSKNSGDYYYHFHNIPRINAKCLSVFSRCKNMLCVSDFVAKEICKKDNPIGPVREEQIKILYNCIDTNLFFDRGYLKNREDIIRKYNLPPDKKIIVFVGRLSKEKGIDVLLKSCRLLNREDYIVLIVGSYIQGLSAKDSYESDLIRISNQLGNVYYTGYIVQNDLPYIYSGADLAVLPSVWNEPAGLTMLEALGCGVELITTRSGGIPEYVPENCATLIDVDEIIVSNLAAAINFSLDKPSEIYRKNGIERVKAFSKEDYYSRFLKALEDK